MKKIVGFIAMTFVFTMIFSFGRSYIYDVLGEKNPQNEIEQPTEKQQETTAYVLIPPISDTQLSAKQPEPIITEDKDGNVEITHVFEKTTKAPDPVVIVDLPPEPEPTTTNTKQEPTTEKPTEAKHKPTEKPTEQKPTISAAKEPKTGDRRVVDGQEQIYMNGFGWVDNRPGGSTIQSDAKPNGNLIGY